MKESNNSYDAKQKVSSTLRSSRAVPHPSTNRALRRLTSEFGRDPVRSTRYGRWRKLGSFFQSEDISCMTTTKMEDCGMGQGVHAAHPLQALDKPQCSIRFGQKK